MGIMMRKTLSQVTLLLLIFLLLAGTTAVQANEGSSVSIRVLLQQGGNIAHFRVEEGNYRLLDTGTGLPLADVIPGQLWKISKVGSVINVYVEGNKVAGPVTGPLLLEPVEMGRNVFSFNNNLYRGGLIISGEKNGLIVVNKLDIEHYLYGVVGKEMGNFAETEALKAQAVVSRTFALASRGNNLYYDVTDNTSSQVYGGFKAEQTPGISRVKEAVDATKGEVIYYDGSLIYAFFHANAGGHTEDAANVWSDSYPYIRPVSSPFDQWAVEYSNQVQGWPANTYQWRKEITKKNLEADFSGIGEVQDIRVSYLQEDGSDTVSGRVTELKVIGSRGEKAYYRDGIRSALGLRSTKFQLQTDSGITILDGSGQTISTNSGTYLVAVAAGGRTEYLNGNADTYNLQGAGTEREVSKVFEKVIIEGQGYGHGLGMSQWGARGMAQEGYNYQQIIQHYYNQGENNIKLTINAYREKLAK